MSLACSALEPNSVVLTSLMASRLNDCQNWPEDNGQQLIVKCMHERVSAMRATRSTDARKTYVLAVTNLIFRYIDMVNVHYEYVKTY